ncbi:MAG: hypothetical protein M3P49_11950 [Actinomycetota bacterium]|nr:hypothetical protein [Actinomycetota bacterium]
MAKGEGRVGPKRLNLIKKGNARNPNSDSVRLDVLVDEETGDLVMEGEDTGPSVEEFMGADEYEFFVRVPEGHKDRLLLHLVKEAFSEGAISSDFMKWLDKKKIPYEFDSY